LWKTAERASDAAEALGITATRLKTLGLVDKVINEPVGGAHRDYQQMMAAMKKSIADGLKNLQAKPIDQLLDDRFERLMGYGKFKEEAVA
jgi:acetyl-CoA carboxylase carboxyl transferase subunit alpha